MTSWPVSGQLTAYTDAEPAATPLFIMQNAIASGDPAELQKLPDATEMLIGQTGGSLGEVSALLLLLGCAFMLWKKIITWHIPVSILGTVAVFSGIMHIVNPVYAMPHIGLLSGGLILGACFMATY